MRYLLAIAAVGAALAGCSSHGLRPERGALYPQDEGARSVDVVRYLDCVVDMQAGDVCAGEARSPSRELAILRFERATLNHAAERDRLLEIMVATSNHNCMRFLNGIRHSRRTIGGTLSATGVITAAAAAITTPESSAQTLSAISALSQDGMGLFNDAVFSRLGAEAIYSSVQTLRFNSLRELRNELGETYEAGELARALTGVEAYHAQCSFQAAEAAASATLANELADAQRLAPSDASDAQDGKDDSEDGPD